MIFGKDVCGFVALIVYLNHVRKGTTGKPQAMHLLACCVVAAAFILSRTGGAAPVSSTLSLDNAIECDVCETVVSVIQALLREKWSEDFIADIVTRICVSLKLKNVDSTVCSGLVRLFKVWSGTI